MYCYHGRVISKPCRCELYSPQIKSQPGGGKCRFMKNGKEQIRKWRISHGEAMKKKKENFMTGPMRGVDTRKRRGVVEEKETIYGEVKKDARLEEALKDPVRREFVKRMMGE